MEAHVLTIAVEELTQDEIENAIIDIFRYCLDAHIMIYGFYYKPGTGIYTVGPQEELEKLENKNIENFDFISYIKEPNTKLFWLADWTNPANPKINRMVK